ncbi:16S rRNA (guanine(527)-N(7))-methyltransferase RsmG [candidate division KSB1 bacterium]|nr:16S rRNA (guanine(527)-N(7))-methyltransferase RsmG [candidate division KSB1 bacterium]
MENEIQALRSKLMNSYIKSDFNLSQFIIYIKLIREWNLRINLISKNDEKRIVERHVLESIAVLDGVEIPPRSLCLDLGSGGGFPGMPIKIVRSDLEISFLDSKRMKCLFLKKVCDELGLNGANVICQRVEAFAQENSKKFDFIFARGVAVLSQLWQWGQTLLSQGGKLLAWKGGELIGEIDALLGAYPDVKTKILKLPSQFVDPALDRKVVIITRDQTNK